MTTHTIRPIVLGIDPGNTSGWAIATDPETVIMHGVATNALQRHRAIGTAVSLSTAGKSCVRVAMEWVTAGGGNARTAMGIGKSRGLWLSLLDLELGMREQRVIRVTPAQWRKATHGVVRATGTREEKEAEFKRAAMAYTGIDQPDAAEAACVAMWAAGELAGREVA